MKIYGHPLSSCTRKVLITLREKNREPELTTVDLFVAEHKSKSHLERHPFGVIPVLDDGDFRLYESRAIIRYLDATLDGALLTPKAPREIARMDQFLSVDQSYVAPHTRALAVERILKKHAGKSADPAIEREAEEALGRTFAIYDRALGQSPYVAGDTFSLADISVAPYVGSLPMIGAAHVIDGLSNLASWWRKISARSSVRASMPSETRERSESTALA